MKAIKGGTFVMGSESKEDYRQSDEGPQREVEVNSFWMGEIEVTWDEYLAFLVLQVLREEKRRNQFLMKRLMVFQGRHRRGGHLTKAGGKVNGQQSPCHTMLQLLIANG